MARHQKEEPNTHIWLRSCLECLTDWVTEVHIGPWVRDVSLITLPPPPPALHSGRHFDFPRSNFRRLGLTVSTLFLFVSVCKNHNFPMGRTSLNLAPWTPASNTKYQGLLFKKLRLPPKPIPQSHATLSPIFMTLKSKKQVDYLRRLLGRMQTSVTFRDVCTI